MSGSDKIYRQLAGAALFSAMIFSFLNLLLVFDFAKGHEMALFRYSVYAAMAMFPLIILGSIISSTLSGPSKKKAKSRDTVHMARGEHLLLNTTPHPFYFLKLAISIGMLMVLLLYFLLVSSYSAPITDAWWWWTLLTISGIVASFAYLGSADLLPHHSYLEGMEHVWALFFAFWWSVTATAVLKAQIELNYPKAFWEEFLGLPSIAMMMFALILFLMSSMIWRIDRYFSGKRGSPLGTISITLMAAGIAALFPPLWFLFSPTVRNTFFYAIMIITLILWVMLSLFIYYKGGMRFIFTNKRIIVIKRFTGTDINEHPYDSIISVELMQGVFGRYFDYGDLKFRVKRGKKTVSFTVNGLRNPALARNMVLILSRKKGKMKKSTHTKKKEIKKKVYYRKPY